MSHKRFERRERERKKIHNSRIPSQEFQNIVERFCIQFGLYPSFIIVKNQRKPTIQNWGDIPLPQIPKEEVTPEVKYWLLNGLGYHAILPSTEANRLMIRYVFAEHISRLSTDSPSVSLLSGIFCTLNCYTKLSRNKKWKDMVENLLQWKIRELQEKEKSLLRNFVQSYFKYLIGEKVEKEFTRLVENAYWILKEPRSIRVKTQEFIELVKDILESESTPSKSLEEKTKDVSSSLGSQINPKTFWGENWRTQDKDTKLSPDDVAELSKVDQAEAMRLAKKLDKKEQESQGKTKQGRQIQSGWLPQYSERQRMFQELLSKRRYIAAVRRVRLQLLLEKMGEFEGKRKVEVGGRTNWKVGDTPGELEIELSLETFGRLIPNLTTLKNFWVESSSGKRGGGARHIELLIDTSGSMEGEPLERAIDIGLALTEKAREREDYIGITTFASGAWEGFPPCRSYNAIQEVLLRLLSQGGTNIRHALQLVHDHVTQSDWNSTLFVITDTAIWDADRPTVQRRMKELAETIPVFLIGLTQHVYSKTKKAFGTSNINIIKLPRNKLKQKGWKITLSKY